MTAGKTVMDRPYVSDSRQDMSLDELIEALHILREKHRAQTTKVGKQPVPVLGIFLHSLTYHVETVSLEDRPSSPFTKDLRPTVVLGLR